MKVQKNKFCFKKQKSPAIIAKDVFIALICFSFTFLSFKIVSPDTKTNAETFYFTPEGSTNQYQLYISYNDSPNMYFYSSDFGATRDNYLNIYANTTCMEGFSATVSSLDDSNDFVYSLDRTKRIASVTEPTETLSNNTWGIFISDSGNTSGAVYSPLPKRSETPLTIYDVTGTSSSTKYLHYGVKLDGTTAAGNWYRDILFTAYSRTQCAGYTAYFYFPSTSGSTTSASIQIPYGSQVDLKSIAQIARNNYNITGITGRQDTTITYSADNPVDINPNNDSYVYYDVNYEFVTPNTFSGITKMQEMTKAICDAETTPLETATNVTFTHSDDRNLVPRSILTDVRDGNTYLVSKLADGNCWMSQNLALDLSTQTTLTKENTDLRTKDSWTPSHNTDTTTGGSSWNYDTARSYHSDKAYRNGYTQNDNTTVDGPDYAWEKAGNLYSWYAATAGSGTRSRTADRESVSDSICPKGWHLPTTYIDNIFNLVSTYNRSPNQMMNSPLNLVVAGYYSGSSLSSTGSEGHYWTASTGIWTDYGSEFRLVRGNSSFTDNGLAQVSQSRGGSIRCTTGSTYQLNLDMSEFTTPKLPSDGIELNFGHRLNIANEIGTRAGATLHGIIVNNEETVVKGWSDDFIVLDTQSIRTTKVANAIPSWRYFGIYAGVTYLQDVTPEICEVTTTPFKDATMSYRSNNNTDYYTGSDRTHIYQTSLRDKRDGKYYTVRKMPNGECWMVSNLNYHTPVTSDSYGPNATTQAMAETTARIQNTDLVDDNYYNRVDNARAQSKYYATQTVPHDPSLDTVTSTMVWGQDGSDGAHSYLNWYRDETEQGVNQIKAYYVVRSTDIDSEKGRYTFYTRGPVPADTPQSERPDTTHWNNVGTYYNWTAAVGGKMGVTSGNAESSICPKGWQLPNATGARSYQGLFQYVRETTSTTSLSDFNWAVDAFKLIPTGYYNWSTGGYTNRGSEGYFWTGTSDGSGKAYAAHIVVSGDTSVQVDTNVSIDKGMGASVHCVLRPASE